MTTCDSLIMNIMSEPYAGKPHVRFDEEGGNPTLTLRYVDGMNLYHGYYVPRGVDPSGLVGVFFEGTLITLDNPSTNIQSLFNNYTDDRLLVQTPGVVSLADNQIIKAYNWIAKKYCGTIKLNCDGTYTGSGVPIDIFGYSRGSIMAIRLAKLLKNYGIKCKRSCLRFTTICGFYFEWEEDVIITIKPISVRYLGLIDTIERGYGNFDTDNIPDNVNDAYHVSRDGSGDNSIEDFVVGDPDTPVAEDPNTTTLTNATSALNHNDIGMNNSVGSALQTNAMAAGVPLNGNNMQ